MAVEHTAPVVELEPPDYAQCQAERPNRTWSPFNLGPANTNPATGEKWGGSVYADRLWRCRRPPACIVEAREPDEHGRKGRMSLCGDCFVQLFLQEPERAGLVEKLDGADE